MPSFFRIVQSHWAGSAMSGEGARRYGGRWNPPGIPAVYLAESRALAALEILVHAPREAVALDWSVIGVTVPDGMIETLMTGKLPRDWRMLPSSAGARRFGADWLSGKTSPAIRLPSAVVPEECTLLINPAHPDFRFLGISAPAAFHFDPRLTSSGPL